MLRHQANGRRMSKEPPYGFAVDLDDPASLIENTTEQQIIERIIAMNNSDMSLRAICRQLQSEGAKCRNKNNWHHTTIKNIIFRNCSRVNYTAKQQELTRILDGMDSIC
jgi:hypothetical protein